MEQRIEFEKIISTLKDPVFDRVLVACHRSPDGDACASSHALAYALRAMGKQSAVFCPDPFGVEFSYMTEVDFGEPFIPEHFVTVDVAAPEMLCGADFVPRIDLVIDHHRKNTVCCDQKLVRPDYASCAQLVMEVILALGVKPDAYLAETLYTGIATDTGCFRYSNTDAKTFQAVAELFPYAEEGAFYRINKRLFETKSKKRIRLEAFAAESFCLTCDGKLAYLSVSLKKQEELGAQYEELDPLINVIRQVEGVEVALVAKEREAGLYKVSVRSEESFDASDYCSCFGGGGHRAAAGCTLAGEETDVLSKLLSEAERRIG